MRFGMHLRELWGLPLGVAASILLAAFAAAWSVANVSVLPPRLEPRELEMATAYTQLVVDTPHSVVMDLRQGTFDLGPLKNRAVLIGTLMASAPVRAYIARHAGIPIERLHVAAPRTPEQPRPVDRTGSKRGPSDLLKSTDQYRLEIQANPSVPLLNITTQAPTAKVAEQLANAAVTGLGDYMRQLATTEKTPRNMRVEIRQLGAAEGTVINRGIQYQVVGAVFILVLALSSAVTILLARVRRGWQLAGAFGR
jgi:hypothetical protein